MEKYTMVKSFLEKVKNKEKFLKELSKRERNWTLNMMLPLSKLDEILNDIK